MEKRNYGKTGLEVSEIGVGTWQLGNNSSWNGPTEEEAIEIVEEAIKKGCNFFDTAPNYANGESEKILGKALKGKRDQVVINSKFGHWPDGHTDYSANLIRKSVEESLKRLDTDYLDSVILHNPPEEVLEGNQGHFEVLEELKNENKIKAYGASIDTSEAMEKLIDNTKSEVIEIMFNMFYQEPKKAFKKAKDAGVALIVKVPLDSGWLTGKYDQNSEFKGVRSRWSKKDIQFRGKLVENVKKIKRKETTMVQEALSFILAFDEVSSVIPGVRNLKQLEQDFSATEMKMDKQKREEYETMYKEKIEGKDLPW
ncbi:MAG: aldo/keto reductase [Fusobacteriota bacterium]